MSSLSQYRVWRPPHQGKTVNGRSLDTGHSTAEITHAAKCELAEKTLRLFGSLRLRVTGFSMIPSVLAWRSPIDSPAGDGANLSG
jgi:hypothetical protein